MIVGLLCSPQTCSLAYLFSRLKGALPAAKLLGIDLEKGQVHKGIDRLNQNLFKNLLFEFDQYELDKAAKKEVLSVYAYLKKHPGYYITVHGHTDNVGRQSYNRILSEKRSQAVARELIRLGLSKTRITWSGKGREFPIASNDTEIGRQQNRRVSFILNKR